jgi:DNA-binding MarR family transcriptional regulator
MVVHKASTTPKDEYGRPKEMASTIGQSGDLNKLIEALNQFCSLNHTMHVPTALVFLQVAMRPGINKPVIQRTLGLSTSACSRHIRMLTKEGYSGTGTSGFGLVWTESDPQDARQKRVWLTPVGVALAQSLREPM